MMKNINAVVLGHGDVVADFVVCDEGKAHVVFHDERNTHITGITFLGENEVDKLIGALSRLRDLAWPEDEDDSEIEAWGQTFFIPFAEPIAA